MINYGWESLNYDFDEFLKIGRRNSDPGLNLFLQNSYKDKNQKSKRFLGSLALPNRKFRPNSVERARKGYKEKKINFRREKRKLNKRKRINGKKEVGDGSNGLNDVQDGSNGQNGPKSSNSYQVKNKASKGSMTQEEPLKTKKCFYCLSESHIIRNCELRSRHSKEKSQARKINDPK